MSPLPTHDPYGDHPVTLDPAALGALRRDAVRRRKTPARLTAVAAITTVLLLAYVAWWITQPGARSPVPFVIAAGAYTVLLGAWWLFRFGAAPILAGSYRLSEAGIHASLDGRTVVIPWQDALRAIDTGRSFIIVRPEGTPELVIPEVSLGDDADLWWETIEQRLTSPIGLRPAAGTRREIVNTRPRFRPQQPPPHED